MDNIYSFLVEEDLVAGGVFLPSPLNNCVRIVIQRFLYHLPVNLRASHAKIFFSDKNVDSVNYDLYACDNTLRFVLRGETELSITITYARVSVPSVHDLVFRFLLKYFPDLMTEDEWVYRFGSLYVHKCVLSIHTGIICGVNKPVGKRIGFTSDKVDKCFLVNDFCGITPDSPLQGYLFPHNFLLEPAYMLVVVSKGTSPHSAYSYLKECIKFGFEFVVSYEKELIRMAEVNRAQLREEEERLMALKYEQDRRDFEEAVDTFAHYYLGKVTGENIYELTISFNSNGKIIKQENELCLRFHVPPNKKLDLPLSSSISTITECKRGDLNYAKLYVKSHSGTRPCARWVDEADTRKKRKIKITNFSSCKWHLAFERYSGMALKETNHRLFFSVKDYDNQYEFLDGEIRTKNHKEKRKKPLLIDK